MTKKLAYTRPTKNILHPGVVNACLSVI